MAVLRGHLAPDDWVGGRDGWLDKWLHKQTTMTSGADQTRMIDFRDGVRRGDALTQQEIGDVFGDLLESAGMPIAPPTPPLAARIAAEIGTVGATNAAPAPAAVPPALPAPVATNTATTSTSNDPTQTLPGSDEDEKGDEGTEDGPDQGSDFAQETGLEEEDMQEREAGEGESDPDDIGTSKDVQQKWVAANNDWLERAKARKVERELVHVRWDPNFYEGEEKDGVDKEGSSWLDRQVQG